MYVHVDVEVDVCVHLSCLVLSHLVSSRLVSSCLVSCDSGRMFRVSLLRCLVCLALSICCVVCCLLTLCSCLVSRVFVVYLCYLVVCIVLVSGLVFRVRSFPGVHRWFCVIFRVPCVLVLFVSVSYRLCVSLSVVVFSRLSVGSCLVVRVPWFLGSVFLCLAVAPYVVYLFVCILCCKETDNVQVPS